VRLSVDNATAYLVDRKLVSVASIVDGDLTIVDSARRNRNLKVISENGPSYLLKQPELSEDGSERTVRAEADFYELCQTDERLVAMRALLPRLVTYLAQDGVLVFELIKDGSTLWQHYTGSPPVEFPTGVGPALGRALGECHAAFRTARLTADPRLSRLSSTAPWILWVHKPGPEILERISAANLKTIKILQKEAQLSQRLDAVRKLWRVETLIHNDIKNDNVLVRKGDDAKASTLEVKIVDWELVQLGDPAWDVGGALSDFLLFWIASIPLSSTRTAEAMLAEAQYPLETLQPAMRGFWRQYRTAAGLGGDESASLLVRSALYAAARLIQSAYEQSQGAPTLSNSAVAMLQVAANIMADAEAALLPLFGIPTGSLPSLPGSVSRPAP
jgi:Ser/Thr protein kinase RdoA (MazF antagonist)